MLQICYISYHYILIKKGEFLMKNATHRVVILKNCNSDLISQAIFFLKDTDPQSESKILAEAEKIVEKYMNNSANSATNFTTQKGSCRKKFLTFLSVGMFLSGLILAVFSLLR